MRTSLILICLLALSDAKTNKRDGRDRSIRKGKDKDGDMPKRQLSDGLAQVTRNNGLLAQVAAVLSDTSQEFLNTALQGNKLLKADAKVTIGSVAQPLYESLQEDARKITESTKELARNLGLETIKLDAKKVIMAASDVVRQGEENLTNAIEEILPPFILKQ